MKYDKLVRNKIPAIIEKSGARAVTRILTDEEFKEYLEKKLDEEVAEFHESKSIEELADILEVLHTLSDVYGYSTHILNCKCEEKYCKRGSFSEKILLIATLEEGEQ